MKLLTREEYLGSEAIRLKYSFYHPFDRHRHDFLELTYILRGTAVNLSGEHPTLLKPGNYILFDYDIDHQIVEKSEDFLCINCLFVPEALDQTLAGCKSFQSMLATVSLPYYLPNKHQLFSDPDHAIQNRLELMMTEAESKPEGYREILRTTLLQILILSIRKLQQNVNAAVQHPLLEQILAFIEEHYAEKELLRSVSRYVSYSPAYISTLFQRELGISFHETVRQIRLRVACRLLRTTKQSIGQIGEAVGYQDVRSFRQNFKEQLLVTPLQYRNYRVTR